jgi:hypothetical protein
MHLPVLSVELIILSLLAGSFKMKGFADAM